MYDRKKSTPNTHSMPNNLSKHVKYIETDNDVFKIKIILSQ